MRQESWWLRWGPHLWDAAGVLLVLATTWQVVQGADAVPILAGLACAALVPLRRRAPALLLVVALLGAAVTQVVVGETGGPGFAVLIGVHAMVVTYGRRLGLACAVGAGALLIASTGITTGHVSVGDLVGPVLGLGLAVAWGDANRARHEYIRALEVRARDVEARLEAEAAQRVAEDRLTIARDLHDAVGHQVAVISLNAGVAKLALPDRPQTATEALEVISTATAAVLRQINELLVALRETPPSTGPGLGALDDLLNDFAGLGLTVEAGVDLDGDVPAAIDAVAYRVVQEGLTNAHKHGANARAQLDLEAGEHLSIRITNATGPRPGPSSGLGLVGMRERVAAVGGTVDADSDGSTFTLTVRLPIEEPS
ncbi:MAG: histidine kinase [Mobilicoccus sp.]|nr:histidine kinase [Mobilicoccus sp.]